jgi:RHS repeat-associated protein
MLTSYSFTGQYSNVNDFGLLFYNARWYDPGLARMAQADTDVPGGVQGYDRYAYVNNDPVVNSDPTGHHCADEDTNGLCPGDAGYDGGSSSGNNGNSSSNNDDNCSTVTCKALNGDGGALVDLLVPTTFGWRVQLEGSIDFSAVVPGVGASYSIGANVVYNRNDGNLAASLDNTGTADASYGFGLSATTGPLVGWASSSVNDVTSGKSGTLSASAAAELAGSVAVNAPFKGNSNTLQVDPKYGQIPATVYGGVGVGGAYAGAGVGHSNTWFHEDLSNLLPWNWSIWP